MAGLVTQNQIQAVKLLLSSELPVTNIAYVLGITSRPSKLLPGQSD